MTFPIADPRFGVASPPRRWDGYYINLDRSEDRRRRTEAELARYGLADQYRRFPAVDGSTMHRTSPLKPGEIGIFRSQLDLLNKIAESGRYAHILEDDEVLCDLTAPAVSNVVNRGIADDFDLVFPETHLGNSLASFRTFHQMYELAMRNGPIQSPEQLQVLDIADNYIYGTFSYIVGPRGLSRLIPALEREWERGPTLPVDLVIRGEALARRLSIGCLFPFVTAPQFESSRANTTTLLGDRDRAMIRPMIRYSYFVRRDLGFATPIIDDALARLKIDESDEAVELFVKALVRFLDLPDRRAGS